MNKTLYVPLAAIIATVFVWGLSFLSIKISLAVFPPMTLAFVRFLFAVAFLYLMLLFDKSKSKLDSKDIPIFIAAGLTGVTLYFLFENNSIKLISASAASIIVATAPIMTLLADTFIFKLGMTRIKLVSVFLSVFGVYLVVGVNTAEFKASGLGYLLMFGANIVWITYSYITRSLTRKYSQVFIVFYQTLFGTIFLIPFILFENTDWQAVTPSILLNVAFLGTLCSAVAYYLYAISLDKLGVNITSVFINLIPVVTVVASYFLLKETIGWYQIVGGIIVVAAVYIANMGENENAVPCADEKGE